MKEMFTKDDYKKLKEGETYENKFVILDVEKIFKPEYQNAKCALFLVQSGFGCNPTKLGGKVFGRLYDEQYVTRREHILGVATEEAIDAWERMYGMTREVFYEET